MNWKQLLNPARFGKTLDAGAQPHLRSEFQRDYDRLIFSSPFRRLQNKTQVFPLPGSVFVHNRLTHSLEVASVGRSLGNEVASHLLEDHDTETQSYLNEIGTIVATASLAHDMGNPPFGHSGEKALSAYFKSGEGKTYQQQVTPAQWKDLTTFEGNANALRLLTHQFNGRRKGGYALTYASLASLIKYPFDSLNATKKDKYGYFASETEAFQTICKACGLKALQDKADSYARHPLVYLVEAADDISYGIMDLEDAHKLGIFSTEETIGFITAFFHPEKDSWFFEKREEAFAQVSDANERIAFLRATVINKLVKESAEVFHANEEAILAGGFTGSLVDYLPDQSKVAMQALQKVSVQKIYQHKSVVEIEIAGYNILSTLVKEFVQATFSPEDSYSKKLLALLPLQYQTASEDPYVKLRAILDFISGMTDLYALELYQLIKGVNVNLQM